MDQDQRVFIVMDEDKDILGAYTTWEKAQDASRVFDVAGLTTPQEITLDVVPEHPEGTALFCVDIDETNIWVSQISPLSIFGTKEQIVEDKRLVTYVWARDEEYAEQLGLERWKQLQNNPRLNQSHTSVTVKD